MKRFATLALVLLFAACSDFTGADTTDHIGVYNISSVNGVALPFTLTDDTATVTQEVIEGSVTLNADRTFTDHTTFRITTDGVETTSQQLVQGQYLRSKNSVTFEGFDNNNSYLNYFGQLDGTTLTIFRGSNLEVAYTR
jgi:hypothetical protein